MRQPKYMSPTSIDSFYSDRQEYYLRYLSDNRAPRFPQNRAMSIGSGFDAYVKNYLSEVVNGGDSQFDLRTIFDQQVEEQNREWAWENSQIVFAAYKDSGALAALVKELENAAEPPRFEFRVQRTVDGVPLLGLPDLYFITKQGAHIIFDWKVNGYCSKNGHSPKAGYVKLHPGGKMHRDAHLMEINGITVNIGKPMEDIDKKWASQLSIYGWLMGEPVGNKLILGIEQLACKPGKIVVASHRSRVSEAFQRRLHARAKNAWELIQRGHIFDDLSLEESHRKCEVLDTYHEKTSDPKDDWFQKMARM